MPIKSTWTPNDRWFEHKGVLVFMLHVEDNADLAYESGAYGLRSDARSPGAPDSAAVADFPAVRAASLPPHPSEDPKATLAYPRGLDAATRLAADRKRIENAIDQGWIGRDSVDRAGIAAWRMAQQKAADAADDALIAKIADERPEGAHHSFHLSFISCRAAQFTSAFELALSGLFERADAMVEGFRDDGGRRLVFFDYIPSGSSGKGVTPFGGKLNAREAASVAWTWLLQKAVFPEEPDTDGSTKKGYRIYTGRNWDQIGFDSGSCLAVEPDWIVFGK